MDNPFKYINQPIEDVPSELKSKVMKDIAMAKLIMEIAKLFSFDIAKVIQMVIDKRDENNNNNN